MIICAYTCINWTSCSTLPIQPANVVTPTAKTNLLLPHTCILILVLITQRVSIQYQIFRQRASKQSNWYMSHLSRNEAQNIKTMKSIYTLSLHRTERLEKLFSSYHVHTLIHYLEAVTASCSDKLQFSPDNSKWQFKTVICDSDRWPHVTPIGAIQIVSTNC
jgi:hypothetical protein